MLMICQQGWLGVTRDPKSLVRVLGIALECEKDIYIMHHSKIAEALHRPDDVLFTTKVW